MGSSWRDLPSFTRIGLPPSIFVSDPKIFVGMPIHKAGETRFWLSIIGMIMRPNKCPLELRTCQGDSLIPRARNELTADFLKSDCTHLFFVDSDIVFTPEQVYTLLDMDSDVIAGYYPKRLESEEIQWVCNELDVPADPEEDGTKKMKMMGTGFMMVKRSVFETILAEMEDEIWYTNDQSGEKQWDFWPVGIWRYPNGVRRYLSEDWYFCERWRARGGTVRGHTLVTVIHIGSVEFPLKSQRDTA
jgi:hypothetical protein